MDEVIEKSPPVFASSGSNAKEQMLDELMSYRLINASERTAALQAPSPPEFPDLACALMWMLHTGILSEMRWNSLRAELQGEAGTGRSRIVADAHEGWELFKAQHKPAGQVSLLRRASGKLLAMIACCCVMAGGYFLYRLSQTIPACTSKGTLSQVDEMLRFVMLQAGNKQAADFRLTQVQEVGYVPAYRLRGCTANVVMGEKSLPFAFVLGPKDGAPWKMGVTGRDRSLVEARFKRASEDGDFSNRAEPVGRQNIVGAIQAQVETRRLMHALLLPEPTSPLALLNKLHPGRTNEIADVEPLGSCREIQVGTRYACRVMIEHNDLSFGAFAVRTQVLEGDFTFVRIAGSNRWQVSDEFTAEFIRAQYHARPATIVSGTNI